MQEDRIKKAKRADDLIVSQSNSSAAVQLLDSWRPVALRRINTEYIIFACIRV